MNKHIVGLLGVAGVIAASLAWAAEQKPPATEAAGWGHCATLAPLKQAPTLDGKLEPGEWDNAAGTVNFMNFSGTLTADFNGMHMDPREGRTLVGFRDRTLYIAVISALPPRGVYGVGKHSEEKARDSELIGDFNGIEIWLDPNRDRRESREGDQAFYQIFVNSVGSIYDAKLVPGAAPDKGWNTEIRSAHHIDNDHRIWTAEIAIDLGAMGWTGSVVGRSMGILVSRNYKGPWQQGTWFPHGGAFVSWYLYPRIFFTQDDPVVCIESLGAAFWEAKPEFKVTIFNPGPARTAAVGMHLRSSDMPDVKDTKTVALPAGGKAEYEFAPAKGTLHTTADHLFSLNVDPVDGGKPWFRYTGMWSQDPRTWVATGKSDRWSKILPIDQKWALRAEANPGASVGVLAYPYLRVFAVNLDASQLVGDPAGQDKDKLSDSAVVTVSLGGKELARQDCSWDLQSGRYGARQQVKLADMPEGQYEIRVKFNRYADPIVKTYTREKYVWEGNTIGITDTIYPPFEAVKADAGTTRVVGREYGVGDLGLWSSVKSLGKEILAGPIAIKVSGVRAQVSEGGGVNRDDAQILRGAAKLVSSTPMKAVYEAEAKHRAVTVRSRCTTELDGCMKVELTLLPPDTRDLNPETLSGLTLDIPLKAELAPLWHAVTTAIRVNPMGELPNGEGVIWDSRQFPNGDWIGNFVPYIWMGGVERGLCVFANNDKGWVLNWDAKKQFSPCQEFIRHGDTVTIRLNLVQKPITLTEPRTIVIGLMASPGKPIPYKDWRAITAWGSGLGKGFEWLPRHTFTMGCAVEDSYNAAYPIHRDYSLYDAKVGLNALAKEKGWDVFLTDWKQRNGLDKPVKELDEGEAMALSRINQHPGTNGYGGMYWDEYHADCRRHPETRVFNGEWRNNMAASRRDFRCYYGAETVKRGIGLYFDNAYPHLSKDPLTSDAYEIPGLGVQGSAGLWEQREYHRRMWNIHRQFGALWGNRPMEMIHMTNTQLIPMLTWNDMNCDLEWFYGPEPQQSKYGLPMLQAETSGRHSGCIPYAFAIIDGCKTAAEQRMAERSKFGAMMVHDIRISLNAAEIQKLARILHGFGYGRSGVFPDEKDPDTVYNYWSDGCPFTCDKPLVKGLLVKRGGELMMLVCSWDKEPTTAGFTLNTSALGLAPQAASDAEGTAEEQAEEARARIEEARKKAATAQARLEGVQKQFDAGKADENQLKIAKSQLASAEKGIKAAEELVSVVEAAAKLPVGFEPKTAKLAVGLDGYGVRIVRMK